MNTTDRHFPDARLEYVRPGFGKGALIRGRGADRRYGHVEVSIHPDLQNTDYSLTWSVPEGSIPSNQHDVILAAANAALQLFVSRRPICGVRATITGGTWLGDATNDLYGEATEAAMTEAIRDARICTDFNRDA